jgi:general secretion pathway protein I
MRHTKATKNEEDVAQGRRTGGFTLLEVIVAVSIIAIVFISVFRLHTQTLAMSSSVRFYATAPMLAQSKLAELENSAEDLLSDGSGDFGDDFPGFSWEAVVSDVDSELLEDTAKDLKRIDLSVSFEGIAYRVRTYRFLRPEEQ